jgi:hypothetical protein
MRASARANNRHFSGCEHYGRRLLPAMRPCIVKSIL